MAREDIIEAIIDHEADVSEFIAETTNRLDVSKKKLRALVRKVYERRMLGKLSALEARKMFLRGFLGLSLYEYAYDVGKVKTTVDKHLERQFEYLKKRAKPLSSLGMVERSEIKARLKARRQTKLAEEEEEGECCCSECVGAGCG